VPGPNKRVYFPCLGIAKCPDTSIYNEVISAEVGVSLNINNIITPGSVTPAGQYSDIPESTFSYTSYLQTFTPIADEDGVNNFVGWDMLVGLDSDTNQTFGGLFSGTSTLLSGSVNGSSPYDGIRCSLCTLSSISYDLPVDGNFTVSRTYQGFSKKVLPNAGGYTFTESTGKVKRRQCFQGTLPSRISNNAIQNIKIEFSVNRTPVPEFATRKPYAVYVNFPIESTITFDMIVQRLDKYNLDALQTACKNIGVTSEDITISVDGAGSITLKKAYVNSIQYNGGSANSNDNQTVSVTYKSYEPITNIKPVIITPDEDPCL